MSSLSGEAPGVGSKPFGLSYTDFLAERERQRETRKARREAARSLYSDDGGLPVLRASFAAYLDSLGTKEASSRMTNEDLRLTLQDSEDLAWFLHDEEREEHRQRVLSFSDNVVVGSPVDDSYADGGLFNTVFSVALYQLNRVMRGRFLRGGITRGPLYMDDRHAIGDALVQAVLLEERTAVYPRVLVGLDAMEGVPEEVALSGEPFFSPHNRYLCVNGDQIVVNYLAGLEEDSDFEPDAVERGLSVHRDHIVSNLRQHAANSGVRDKYAWAALYHNWVCAEFFDRQDLKVTEAASFTELAEASTFGLLVRRTPKTDGR